MLIVKLLNRLFGWDYIAWKNTADYGVARVQVDGNGRVFYWRYKITKVADLIIVDSQVLWLTCHPSKYMVTTAGEREMPQPSNNYSAAQLN